VRYVGNVVGLDDEFQMEAKKLDQLIQKEHQMLAAESYNLLQGMKQDLKKALGPTNNM
jgi:hypothetical protein